MSRSSLNGVLIAICVLFAAPVFHGSWFGYSRYSHVHVGERRIFLLDESTEFSTSAEVRNLFAIVLFFVKYGPCAMLVFVKCLYLMGLSLKFMVQTAITSLVPRPRPAFNRLQYGKAGRA